jgi:preprotein translocase subunit YajC
VKFGTMDLVFLLATILIMYFLFFLPQRRKQQALNKMLGSLKRGDRVLTTSGMYGEVYAVKDSLITLEFNGGARIDFDKSAIAQAVSPDKVEAKG